MTESQSLIYRVVPKCGCSTIGQAMYASEKGHFHDGDIKHSPPGVILKWEREADRPAIRAAASNRAGVAFGCVRNPYTRILSAFFNKIAGRVRGDTVYRQDVMQPLLERYGVVIGTPENGFQFDQIPAFRRFLLMIRDAGMVQGSGRDTHWAPATPMLGSFIEGGGRFDRIIPLEGISAGLQQVMDRAPIRHPVDVAAMPRFNEIGENGPKIAHPVAAFYDDLTIHLMAEMFHDDFALLGYDATDPARSQPLAEVDLDRLHARFRPGGTVVRRTFTPAGGEIGR